jgi:hypothetical protein
MKFSIGDKVLLKRTMEEAEVYSIISSSMVEVIFEDTVFPIFLDEIDHPYLHWFTQKKNTEKKTLQELPLEKDFIVPEIQPGFHLLFIPQYQLHAMEEQVYKVKVYLLNGLQQDVSFDYKVANHFVDFKLQSQVFNNQSFYVHDLDFEAISANPNFTIIVYHLDEFKNRGYAELQLKLNTKKLAQHLHESKIQGIPSFQYALWQNKRAVKIDDAQPKESSIKYLKIGAQRAKHVQNKGYEHYYLPDVIDIHIEKLVPNYKGMHNAEILQLQLKHAMHAVEHAYTANKDRITIIHGVGEGVLKDQLHDLLKCNAHVKSFNNNWQQNFGFGATEIYLK